MMDDTKIKWIVWLNKSESKLKQVSSLSIPISLCVQACMFKLVYWTVSKPCGMLLCAQGGCSDGQVMQCAEEKEDNLCVLCH